MSNLAPAKVKANAHYICQECGSTELIQAHHEIPSDDDTLIALCAECHSRRHPNVPKGLFITAKPTKSKPKYSRNRNLLRLYRDNNYTLRSLARMFHISPNRVYQIVKE